MSTRYIKTESNGVYTFSPVDAADVNADGKLDTKDTLAVVAAIPKPPPIQPPPVDPPPVISGGVTTVTARPGDDLSSIAADIVVLRGGTYLPAPNIVGLNYAAPLMILQGGSSLNPRTYKAYPGEVPVISGKGCTYAVRVGDVRNDKGAGFVVIDGIEACDADWNGIQLYRVDNWSVRNCWTHGNSNNAYKAGIEMTGGSNGLIDSCRSNDNGYGIESYELDEGVTNPVGSQAIIVRGCFVYGNSRSSNVGNSAGIGFRFGTRCVVENNIIYDNPDAGINGLGNTFCRFVNNVSFNNWSNSDGANREGIKFSVRGGGLNIDAGNISVYNGNTGFDACEGVADLLANNTFYGNGSKGILLEGELTALFNNASEANDLLGANATDPYKDLRLFDAINQLAGSDYNLLASVSAGELKNFGVEMPHSMLGVSAGFANPVIAVRRESERQQFAPSDLWNGMTGDTKTDAAAVRKLFEARYTSASLAGKGLGADAIKAAYVGQIPTIIAALKARIVAYGTDLNFQKQQAQSRYQQCIDALQAGWVPDLSGLPISSTIGAVQ